MVRSIERKQEELRKESGLFIPETEIEDEQVASGQVVSSSSAEYIKGDVIFFHKVLPVDVNMKYESKEMEKFWFISPKDIIFKVEK